MRLRDRAILFISSGGFVGKIPFAPGTFGSVLGLPICYCLSFVKVQIAILVTVLFVAVSIWIADGAEKLLRSKDPGYIVIDEIAGLLVTFLGIPFNMLNGTAGEFFFKHPGRKRFQDIHDSKNQKPGCHIQQIKGDPKKCNQQSGNFIDYDTSGIL